MREHSFDHNARQRRGLSRKFTRIANMYADPMHTGIKADAYGHGAVAVAREAEKNGADFLAVALLQEGLELREAGIRLPILVLGSLQPGAANVVVQFDISHAVFDEERLYALNKKTQDTYVCVRLRLIQNPMTLWSNYMLFKMICQ